MQRFLCRGTLTRAWQLHKLGDENDTLIVHALEDGHYLWVSHGYPDGRLLNADLLARCYQPGDWVACCYPRKVYKRNRQFRFAQCGMSCELVVEYQPGPDKDHFYIEVRLPTAKELKEC